MILVPDINENDFYVGGFHGRGIFTSFNLLEQLLFIALKRVDPQLDMIKPDYL